MPTNLLSRGANGQPSCRSRSTPRPSTSKRATSRAIGTHARADLRRQLPAQRVRHLARAQRRRPQRRRRPTSRTRSSSATTSAGSSAAAWTSSRRSTTPCSRRGPRCCSSPTPTRRSACRSTARSARHRSSTTTSTTSDPQPGQPESRSRRSLAKFVFPVARGRQSGPEAGDDDGVRDRLHGRHSASAPR